MGIILKLFPFSAFTAYALVAITTALAGIAAYFLVNKMVNSKWLSLVIVTLLLFGFNSFEQAIQYPNSGALRFEFMQAVTLLLAWHILSTNGSKGLAAAFLFGIFMLWDPASQAFAALPLAGGLLYQRFVRKEGIALKKMICIALSALATMLVVVIFSAKLPDGGIKGIIDRTAGISQLYYEGYGGLPQTAAWVDILWLVMFVIGIALLLQKVIERQPLSNKELFLAVSLAFVVPVLLYHFNRNSWIGENAIGWIMLPTTFFIGTMIWEANSKKTGFYEAAAGLLVILFISQNAVGQFIDRSNSVFFSAESARAQWSNQCAQQVSQGKACDQKWPDPFLELRETADTPLIDPDDYFVSTMIDLCKSNMPILSAHDSFIYLYGKCSSQLQLSAITFAADTIATQKVLHQLLTYEEVAIDWRAVYYLAPYFQEAVRQFEKAGYCSTPIADGWIVIFHRDCGSDDTQTPAS